MFNLELLYNKVLLTVSETAKVLGIPKNDVVGLIGNGTLTAVETGAKTYVPSADIVKMVDISSIDSGQLASGYPLVNPLYLSQQNESGDDSMAYSANISTLKDGRFMVQVNLGKNPDGSRNRESKSFRDLRSAEQYKAERLAQLNGFVPIIQKQNFVFDSHTYTDKTFAEYTKVLLNMWSSSASTRTIEGYRTSVVPVLKYIGEEKMTAIDKEELFTMYNVLAADYGKSTLTKAFNTTKKIFTEAYDNEDIPANPFARLKCPKSKKGTKSEREPYSDNDIAKMFECARAYHNKMVYPMLTVAECTGMRPGELRALEWKNFDAENKTIHISNAIVAVYDEITDLTTKPKSREVLGDTKSAYGVRTLPLSDLAVEALIEWRAVLDTEIEPMRNSNFIFPSKEGIFKTESSVKCIFQRFIEHYGLEYIGFMLYRFRHTVCTRLALAGVPISVTQRIMGDNTVDVIMKIYTHVSNEQALVACSDYYDKQNLKNAELHSSKN